MKPMNVEWRRILFESAEKIRVAVMPFFQKRERKSLGIGAGGDEIKQIDLVAE
ncbi:fructose-1,6-bisphosphatase, partial [Candidatus Bathyarchaeota archaeon]